MAAKHEAAIKVKEERIFVLDSIYIPTDKAARNIKRLVARLNVHTPFFN